MGLQWPSIATEGGDLSNEEQTAVKALLDEFADEVARKLTALGLRVHDSPLWRPWRLVVVRDAEKILVAFSPLSGGVADIKWLDHRHQLFPPADLARAIRDQLGSSIGALITLPLPEAPGRGEQLRAAAAQHTVEVERSTRLGRLGDLTGLLHLEPHLREFLNDHPDPQRNVFVMMRFLSSPQLDDIHSAIKATLADRGCHAVRADDRDYTGELWSNIEVCMTCCSLGVAVFEDIERRDFNPNVSLELGYMLGRIRRCLILKEQRLPTLPADVMHRLYKPFDMFNVAASVSREVARWVDIDLGISGQR